MKQLYEVGEVVKFKAGDKVKLIVYVGPSRNDGINGGVEKGDTLVCVDKREPLKGYRLGNGEVSVEWANDYKSYFEKKKQMKADDKISVEFTGKQLAKLYAMSGKYNGPSDSSVFNILRDILDPMQKKYNKMLLNKDPVAASNYCGYVDAWEELLFREEKSPAQIEMESLQTKIEELTKQAEKLQNIINK